MGRYTFRLPDIGEGIAQAEIVAWRVRLGDRVEEDGPLADMMTDKATVEMESPVSGTVVALAGEAGDVVAIGAPLVVIEVDGEGNESESPAGAPPKGASTSSVRTDNAVDPVSGPVPIGPVPIGPESTAADSPSVRPEPVEGRTRQSFSSGKALASPAVRARAAALGIDLARVPAASGRVTHADLDAWLLARRPAPVAAPETKAEPARPVELLEGAGEAVKVIGLRRRIAENMAASKRHIPHFSYVEECDVTALEAMRAELNAQKGERPKLTVLPLLIAAICRALPDYPMINARYDEAAGVVQRYAAVHLGVATQTGAGLMAPVIRGAQAMSLWELSAEIARLAAAARDGSARPEELSGSTLTITSLGPLGGIATTPVINRPEVAIIGPNKIVERPMFMPDGAGGERIEKRKLMNISVSCDHRVVDGADAANFVQAVRRWIEAPMMLLAG